MDVNDSDLVDISQSIILSVFDNLWAVDSCLLSTIDLPLVMEQMIGTNDKIATAIVFERGLESGHDSHNRCPQ